MRPRTQQSIPAALERASTSLERAFAAWHRGARRRGLGLALRALARCEALLGSRHPDLGPVVAEIGVMHEELGDRATARRAYARALRLAERDASEEARARLVTALCRLGNLRRAEGAYTHARALLERALALVQRRPRDPAALAGVLNDIGVLCKYTARFADGARCYRRALRLAEAALGPEHVAVASILHNMGGLEHARGRYARGEPYARRAVAIREKLLGPDHPDVAADRAALAGILDGLGRFDESRAIYERALTIFEDAYGPDHYEVAVTLNNLAALHHACGRVGAAEGLYRRAIVIKEKLLGRRHPDVAMTLHNLGRLLGDTGRRAEGERLRRRALAIFEAALPANDPRLITARVGLAEPTCSSRADGNESRGAAVQGAACKST